MGIFFESQPTPEQTVELETILQPHLGQALRAQPQSSKDATTQASQSVEAVLKTDAVQTMSTPAQRRLRADLTKVLEASYKAPAVPASSAPVVAAISSHHVASRARSKRIIWSRLLIAVAALTVLVAAAIWTETAGLKTAPDNLWKIATSGIGSVLGLLIGEKVST
jgi:hypothetical protein